MGQGTARQKGCGVLSEDGGGEKFTARLCCLSNRESAILLATFDCKTSTAKVDSVSVNAEDSMVGKGW
jgi:hypothetical protein